MISMQYNIKLPSDYDMDIKKNRVRDNGFKTDGFQDLEMKAYLIAEKDKHGNKDNEYAPFYLWRGMKGFNQFLLGGPFNNILHSFGWTNVNTWQVLHSECKKSYDLQYAVVNKTRIMACDDFNTFAKDQSEKFTMSIRETDVTANTIAYNPTTWELCEFLMSKDLEKLKRNAHGSLIYKLHHLS